MSRGRVAVVLAGALAFGLFAAWAKDPGGSGVGALYEARADLGNLSAPWLLVAFLAGTQCNRLRSGAALGLAATAVALAGFYVFNALVVDLGHHGLVGDLRLEFGGNLIWFKGGLLTGPLFGLLGAWWRQTRSLLAGALLVAEPVVAATGVIPHWGLTPGASHVALGVFVAEFAVGALVLAAAQRARRASSSST